MFTEPNNDSPLNAQAAELWSNQDTYKRVLLERYERDTKWLVNAVRVGKQRLWLTALILSQWDLHESS